MSDQILTVDSETKILTVDNKVNLITVYRGEKGDPGDGGSSGEILNHNNSTTSHQDLRAAIGNKASPYSHIQSTLSTSWIINHNLNKPVSITTFDSSGSQIMGDVVINSSNVLIVVFAIAVNGSAYIV